MNATVNYGPNENLTLTETELDACRPVRGEGGRSLRAYCPFHQSDHQRSLRVNLETGHFSCFACEAWGYLDWARERWKAERAGERAQSVGNRQSRVPQRKAPVLAPRLAIRQRKPVEPVRDDLAELLVSYQAALPGSWGEEYLRRRGISLELAQHYGVGYAAAGQWVHQSRDSKWGRLVFPHTDPCGRLVNLYGRAVGSDAKVPKPLRHDHLPGSKGYFNAPALKASDGPLFVTEGSFDAISLIAAGYPRTIAIFGVSGWRWDWARDIHELVFALDADAAGEKAWRELAREARLRGKWVCFLPPEAYAGHKDVNAAWVAGVLTVEG